MSDPFAPIEAHARQHIAEGKSLDGFTIYPGDTSDTAQCRTCEQKFTLTRVRDAEDNPSVHVYQEPI